jgi:DNA-binding transcriptional LysR family regulator
MTTLTVAFEVRLPHARWGPMFHVFCLEQGEVTLEWRPTEFPRDGRSLVEGADIGVFLHPPHEDGLRALTLDASPMAVVMAVGHRLAGHDELSVADVLDEPFPGGPSLDPAWSAFWTLDEQRGAPAKRSDDDVRCAEDGVAVVASGRAIATVPMWVPDGLTHPGVIALPLRDAPHAETRLVWRSDATSRAVRSLVELARAWTRERGPG